MEVDDSYEGESYPYEPQCAHAVILKAVQAAAEKTVAAAEIVTPEVVKEVLETAINEFKTIFKAD